MPHASKIALEMGDDDVRDFIFPDRGFVRGGAVQDFVNRHLGNRSIEELKRPFAAVATDLQEGRTVVFNRGNAGIAVRASSSIPGRFQPARRRTFREEPARCPEAVITRLPGAANAGVADGTRTHNTRNHNPVLYP
jgi:hypothetical protein